LNRQTHGVIGLLVAVGAVLIGVVVPLLGLVILPQYWLWQNALYSTAFWVVSISASVYIYSTMCKGCDNTFCS